MEKDGQKVPDTEGSAKVIPPQQTVVPEVASEDSEPEAITSSIEPGISASWSASEFVDHQKGFSWYFMLLIVIVVIAGIVFVLLHSIFSTVMIALIGLAFAIAAGRRPRVLDYVVDGDGITVGQKIHHYTELKSYSVIPDGAFSSILIIPAKRFSPPISVYYEPKDEQKILDIIGNHLPQEDASKDYVEQLMRRMRF